MNLDAVGPAGNFDGIFAGCAVGWVSKAVDGSEMGVCICSSCHEVIANGIAHIKRADLSEDRIGFNIPLPNSILHCPGEVIFAKKCGEDIFFPGSPVEITPASPYRIHLDGFAKPDKITGWLKDATCPEKLTQLELCHEGEVIASSDNSFKIDEYRTAGRFVFDIPDSFRDGRFRTFEIKLAADGTRLLSFRAIAFADDDSAVKLADYPFLATPSSESVPSVLIEKRKIRKARTVHSEELLLLPQADAAISLSHKRLSELACKYEDEGQLANALAAWGWAAKAMPMLPEPHAHIIYCLYHSAKEKEALAYLNSLPSQLRKAPALLEWKRRIEAMYRDKSARIIAFYLPQYHPIPENDKWWGKGFTEWSNVASAQPLFPGHQQPRIPRDVGYYDLRLPGTANAQFALAKKYGIDGFCYYYYWFNGKRLLEKPLDDLVSGRTGPFPFCICWANEPWTRAWDGVSGEYLMRQTHSLESDAKFIEDALPYLSHPAYIRHGGKAVLLVYRADKMADPAETAKYWRRYCLDNGVGELLLCYVQSFHQYYDPKQIGFDAAVELPPHYSQELYEKSYSQIELSSLVNGATPGHLYDYMAFCESFMEQNHPDYMTFHTSMLAWDNTPRRKNGGTVYHGFTPQLHGRWLWHNLASGTREHGNTLVFINAWNEWAEGTVLEPDSIWGYENLELTRKVGKAAEYAWHDTFWKNGLPVAYEPALPSSMCILLVGHDAHPHGAQLNLLNIAKTLKHDLSCTVHILLLAGGALVTSYVRYGDVHVIDNLPDPQEQISALAKTLYQEGLRHAICNTSATGVASKILSDHGYRVVNLVHELPALIAEHSLDSSCWQMAGTNQPIVFATSVVGDEFCRRFWPALQKCILMPQGINDSFFDRDDNAVITVREELGVAPDALVVAGCGYGDYRKGIDLFILLAGETKKQLQPRQIAFIWIGNIDERLLSYINADIEKMGLKGDIYITGLTGDAKGYLQAADIFALTSREDPYPSVVMEAISSGLPVVAFKDGGGYVELINEETGMLVPYLDIDAMVNAIVNIDEKLKSGSISPAALNAYAKEHFNYAHYADGLLRLFDPLQIKHFSKLYPYESVPEAHFKVSVIVPNFNYARYLELRLRTIIDQTLKPYEIIILDDCSTDTSLDIITRVMRHTDVKFKVVRNERNSGSVFQQWLKGIEIAEGDLIWIAEADDYCELNMLENLVPEFGDPELVFAFSDSIAVDADGKSKGETYKLWYRDKVDGVTWDHDLKLDGRELIRNALFYYNCVPNASAVVFRKESLPENLPDITKFHYSGDWLFWVLLAANGKIFYQTEPMNYHRRHKQSVVQHRLKNEIVFFKEAIANYITFVEFFPSLLDMRVTFEMMRQLEKLYSGFERLRSESYYLKNCKDLQTDYARLLQILAPEKYIEGCAKSGKARVLLDLESTAVNDDTKNLIFWLSREKELTVYVIGKIIKHHPLYLYCRENDVKIRFVRNDSLADHFETGDEIWLLGINPVLGVLESGQRCANNLTIVIDDTFDRLYGQASKLDMRRLFVLFSNAKEIFRISGKQSHVAARLVSGARRLSPVLPAKKFSNLFSVIKESEKMKYITPSLKTYSFDGICS